jgi:hypothetical protein
MLPEAKEEIYAMNLKRKCKILLLLNNKCITFYVNTFHLIHFVLISNTGTQRDSLMMMMMMMMMMLTHRNM